MVTYRLLLSLSVSIIGAGSSKERDERDWPLSSRRSLVKDQDPLPRGDTYKNKLKSRERSSLIPYAIYHKPI